MRRDQKRPVSVWFPGRIHPNTRSRVRNYHSTGGLGSCLISGHTPQCSQRRFLLLIGRPTPPVLKSRHGSAQQPTHRLRHLSIKIKLRAEEVSQNDQDQHPQQRRGRFLDRVTLPTAARTSHLRASMLVKCSCHDQQTDLRRSKHGRRASRAAPRSIRGRDRDSGMLTKGSKPRWIDPVSLCPKPEEIGIEGEVVEEAMRPHSPPLPRAPRGQTPDRRAVTDGNPHHSRKQEFVSRKTWHNLGARRCRHATTSCSARC